MTTNVIFPDAFDRIRERIRGARQAVIFHDPADPARLLDACAVLVCIDPSPEVRTAARIVLDEAGAMA